MSMADAPTFSTSGSIAGETATRTIRAVFSRLTNHHSMTPAWIICVITVAQPAPWMPSPWSRRARMNRGASTMLRTAPPPMMAMARASSPLPRMTMFELCAKFTNRLPTSMMRR